MMNWTFWRLLFGIALVGAVGLEFLGEPYAPEHVWDYALFFAVAGLLGCLILSFLAKGVMAPALDRPEDFYGEADADYDWSTESPAAQDGEHGDRGPSGTGRGRGEG
jgi:hypothetical protein